MWISLLASALIASETLPSATFRVGIEMPSQIPSIPAVENALRDMGITWINSYVVNSPGVDLPEQETNQGMLDLCQRLKLEFAHACHHRNPSEESVHNGLASGKDRYLGVLFDELAHIRLLHPEYAATAPEDMLADGSKFTDLFSAYDQVSDGYRRLKAHYDSWGAPRVIATHVWPNFLHLAARAGFIPCPKICKEFYSPVSLAIGLGAALQYDREFWVDCDMWYYQLVPGHTPEEIRANLLFAYWMGADRVYLEGSGYNLLPAGKQGTPFSLVNVISPDRYQLTPHGEVLKWFCRTYIPAHPRPYTFRDIHPTTAIIRFEDGDFGQKSVGTKHLYGSSNLTGDADTRAWLSIWNLLTYGKTGTDGLTYFKNTCAGPPNDPRYHNEVTPSYLNDNVSSGMHSFFVPLDGVVVFDDFVGYERLKGIPLLFLTGKRVSEETMTAIRRCVDEGAVCIAWGPLARQNGFSDWQNGVTVIPQGKGRFVLTDDFGSQDTLVQYYNFRGRPDEISYRFGDQQVTLRRITDNDIEVEIH